MQITFDESYQAIEFVFDCKRKGVLTVLSADKLSVTFPAYKASVVGEILQDACRS